MVQVADDEPAHCPAEPNSVQVRPSQLGASEPGAAQVDVFEHDIGEQPTQVRTCQVDAPPRGSVVALGGSADLGIAQ